LGNALFVLLQRILHGVIVVGHRQLIGIGIRFTVCCRCRIDVWTVFEHDCAVIVRNIIICDTIFVLEVIPDSYDCHGNPPLQIKKRLLPESPKVWYNRFVQANLWRAASGKEVKRKMETYQTILVMLGFGTFILALLTYIERKK
jgi:hypothetical protein